LRKKKAIIEKAKAGNLTLDDETWCFITSNQVNEVFLYLLKKFSESLEYAGTSSETSNKFYKLLVSYVDALPRK
jgi:hypothetical protein